MSRSDPRIFRSYTKKPEKIVAKPAAQEETANEVGENYGDAPKSSAPTEKNYKSIPSEQQEEDE